MLAAIVTLLGIVVIALTARSVNRAFDDAERPVRK